MAGLLVVLPVITPTYADTCVESMMMPGSSSGFGRDDVLIVDNSREGWAAERYGLRTHRDPEGHNLGVARSWNVGVAEVLERNLDYLVVCSTAMRFGPELHCTWRWQLEAHWGAVAIEAEGHSWHAIAFHRRVFEAVGAYDGNFYPAYEEAVDHGYRMRLVGMEGGWPRVWFNAMSQGHALHNQVVACPNPPLAKYYADKWAGSKGQEQNVQPWGDKPLDYWPDTPIPDLAREYGLGEYGVGWW